MKIRDLLSILNDLTVESLELDVYIDVEGDEYREMEFVPIVDADDGTPMGFVICEVKDTTEVDDKQLKLPFDEVH